MSKKSTTLLTGDFEYVVLTETEEFIELYRRMQEERLLWSMYPDVPASMWTEPLGVGLLDRNEQLVLAGFYNGKLSGFMTLMPTRLVGRCCEVAFLAFRHAFDIAIDLCKGAIVWTLENQNIDSLVGYIPKPSRHSMRLIGEVGFKCIGEIPGYTWYDRIQKFVPSYVVVADRKSLEEACDGWRRRWLRSAGGCSSAEGTDDKADDGIRKGDDSGDAGEKQTEEGGKRQYSSL